MDGKWGNYAWYFLHCIADSCLHRSKQKMTIIATAIKLIPCPECSDDALEWLANHQNYTDYTTLIIDLHNHVNNKLNKKQFDHMEYEKITSKNIEPSKLLYFMRFLVENLETDLSSQLQWRMLWESIKVFPEIIEMQPREPIYDWLCLFTRPNIHLN